MKCLSSDCLANNALWMAFWAGLIPPSWTDFLIRLLIGWAAVPMAFSRLIWAGADYWRNNCYPSEPRSIVADVSSGGAGTERAGKGELPKNKWERKRVRENANECKNPWGTGNEEFWEKGQEKKSRKRDVLKTEKEKHGLIRVNVMLSYHNWKLAACVESLKSIPMETVTETSGSSRSASGKEGRKEEKKKGRVSDKGTLCGVGKNEANGERMKWLRRRRRRRWAAAEWNRQASTPLVFSTSQSKATMCEKSIPQSHSTHL